MYCLSNINFLLIRINYSSYILKVKLSFGNKKTNLIRSTSKIFLSNQNLNKESSSKVNNIKKRGILIDSREETQRRRY